MEIQTAWVGPTALLGPCWTIL